MPRDLAALPKGHLHLHFEASMRPATLRDLAAEAEEPVPAWAGFEDFTDFEAAYGQVVALVRSKEHVARIMHEMADDAKADGVVYVEVTLAPVFYAGWFEDGAEGALEFLLAVAAAAELRTGVVIRAMIASARTFPVELAVEDCTRTSADSRRPRSRRPSTSRGGRAC